MELEEERGRQLEAGLAVLIDGVGLRGRRRQRGARRGAKPTEARGGRSGRSRCFETAPLSGFVQCASPAAHRPARPSSKGRTVTQMRRHICPATNHRPTCSSSMSSTRATGMPACITCVAASTAPCRRRAWGEAAAGGSRWLSGGEPPASSPRPPCALLHPTDRRLPTRLHGLKGAHRGGRRLGLAIEAQRHLCDDPQGALAAHKERRQVVARARLAHAAAWRGRGQRGWGAGRGGLLGAHNEASPAGRRSECSGSRRNSRAHPSW